MPVAKKGQFADVDTDYCSLLCTIGITSINFESITFYGDLCA